jgi:predicted hotdog family 3-hydroxylacyl-ACP dehydratase
MTLDAEEIATLIPHGASMCLLDRVLEWSDDAIVCASDSHRRADNPLRRDGRLSAVHLLEYAAQSMAVHGALVARRQRTQPRQGVLAAARAVQLEVDRIDDLPGEITVRSERLLDDGATMIYAFTASSAGRPVARGRLTVVLPPHDADATGPV